MTRKELQLVINGDRIAQEQFYTEHEKLIIKLTRKFCKNKEEQEDIVQVVMEKIFKGLLIFDHNYKFSTWASKVAINVAIDRKRNRSIEFAKSLERIDFPKQNDGEDQYVLEPRESYPDPLMSMMKKEKAKLIRETLSLLNEKDREIITMRFLNELSYKEIALQADISMNTVKVSIHRSILELRDIYNSKKYNFR